MEVFYESENCQHNFMNENDIVTHLPRLSEKDPMKNARIIGMTWPAIELYCKNVDVVF